MKKLPLLSTILTIGLLTAACGSNTSADISAYNVDVYSPRHASGFSIVSAPEGSSTIITATNPWQGADSVSTSLFIARNGEKAPDGFNGQVIDHTPERIVVMSGTYIAMLDAIDAVDRIAGVSGIGYISNDYITAHRDKIGDVGYENNIDYETLLSLNPDLVMLYGLYSASPMEARLKELNIPYMYIGDYVENSPLGKSEWVVALGEVTGRREKAVELFDSIESRYMSLKNRVAEEVIDAPTVMLNTPYSDTWYMPSTSSYVVQLINDAGGDYIYKKNTGNASGAIDLEEAYMLASQADMWLDTGTYNTLEALAAACPKFTDTRCFINGDVYNNTRQTTSEGGNKFYETAIITPDLVLRDLVKIFHPELVKEDFVYYKKLSDK
ncbi:MAG: ABC transporter substrate-binding protein [Muribaculaceae bacterium]|nr:ABC transporter substrate-binding protein [Muribaculaceae bacterium]